MRSSHLPSSAGRWPAAPCTITAGRGCPTHMFCSSTHMPGMNTSLEVSALDDESFAPAEDEAWVTVVTCMTEDDAPLEAEAELRPPDSEGLLDTLFDAEEAENTAEAEEDELDSRGLRFSGGGGGGGGAPDEDSEEATELCEEEAGAAYAGTIWKLALLSGSCRQVRLSSCKVYDVDVFAMVVASFGYPACSRYDVLSSAYAVSVCARVIPRARMLIAPMRMKRGLMSRTKDRQEKC